MTTVDQIAAATGLNSVLNKQQAKQAGALKELASGETSSSIAKALATPFETEEQTIPIVQRNIALTGNLLSTSSGALSSVAANLQKAIATASQALSAPPSEQAVLAKQFNALINQTKSFVDNANLNGLNLVSSKSQPVNVNTTTEGGKLTIANAPSDAASLGVSNLPESGAKSSSALQAALNQAQSALNQVTATQAKFAAAQSALNAAASVNQSSELAAAQSASVLKDADVGAAASAERQGRTQSKFAADALREHDKREKAELRLLDK